MPAIPRVSTNLEKFEVYKAQLARYKLAFDQGFYLEAIFILYAMLEDRLAAVLFHAGLTNSVRSKITSNKNVKPLMDMICRSPSGKAIRSMEKISIKLDLTQKLLVWAADYEPDLNASPYLSALAVHLQHTAGVNEFPAVIQQVIDWCKARNELVHALMTKSMEGQQDVLINLAKQGYFLSRQVNNFVKSLKRGKSMRRIYNIQ